MKIPMNFLYVLFMLLLALACGSGNNEYVINSYETEKEFADYWFKGEAEISSYDLEQARYGEIHKGTAVMVFVTEDFSVSKQVKLDEPEKHASDALKVMKLNLTKKFNTGIYPYSMMQSVFSPVGKVKNTMKVSMSSQEWCGHTYTQLNEEKDNYNLLLRSYFESEGDQSRKLEKVFLEDEIWTRIKLRPEQLPTGEFNIIPAVMASRLLHRPLDVEKVKAELSDDGEKYKVYRLEYQQSQRTLAIKFGKEFPYEILSWEETYISGWGDRAQKLTTVATKRKTIKLDYWNKNHVSDSTYRKLLFN